MAREKSQVEEDDKDPRHPCEICGRKLKNTPGNISTHRRVHDPDSTYSKEAAEFSPAVTCNNKGCSATFNTRRSLLYHHRGVHKQRGNRHELYASYNLPSM